MQRMAVLVEVFVGDRNIGLARRGQAEIVGFKLLESADDRPGDFVDGDRPDCR
jgi:hypothetical protein